MRTDKTYPKREFCVSIRFLQISFSFAEWNVTG